MKSTNRPIDGGNEGGGRTRPSGEPLNYLLSAVAKEKLKPVRVRVHSRSRSIDWWTYKEQRLCVLSRVVAKVTTASFDSPLLISFMEYGRDVSRGVEQQTPLPPTTTLPYPLRHHCRRLTVLLIYFNRSKTRQGESDPLLRCQISEYIYAEMEHIFGNSVQSCTPQHTSSHTSDLVPPPL